MSHPSNTALWEHLAEFFEEKFGREPTDEEMNEAWNALEEGE